MHLALKRITSGFGRPLSARERRLASALGCISLRSGSHLALATLCPLASVDCRLALAIGCISLCSGSSGFGHILSARVSRESVDYRLASAYAPDACAGPSAHAITARCGWRFGSRAGSAPKMGGSRAISSGRTCSIQIPYPPPPQLSSRSTAHSTLTGRSGERAGARVRQLRTFVCSGDSRPRFGGSVLDGWARAPTVVSALLAQLPVE